MNSILKTLLGLALAVIIAAGGFIGGFASAKWPSGAIPGPNDSVQVDSVGEKLEEVREILARDALEPPSETSSTAGAIRGLLESGGDVYSAYLDERHYAYFNEEMSGEFGGIGVSLGEREGTAYVVDVFDKTPAEKAGIKAGDIFSTIDDVRRQKWATDEVVKRVRGKEGTPVKLTMIRPGKGKVPPKEYTVKLTREVITFPNTRSELKGDVGYIRLAQFNGNATNEIMSAVQTLEKKGAKSFVLDLRNNPGGALDQAVSVTSLFVDSGVVVRVEERNGTDVEHRATAKKITTAPLVVLINANSASASEIVAGALQDYDRATIVGETSFGKGSVQTIKQLSFGGAVKFTTAHYLTPKGRVIDGKGVTPDIVVKMDIEKQMDEATDTQLKRALKEAAQVR